MKLHEKKSKVSLLVSVLCSINIGSAIVFAKGECWIYDNFIQAAVVGIQGYQLTCFISVGDFKGTAIQFRPLLFTRLTNCLFIVFCVA
jgi:hypothetical protein